MYFDINGRKVFATTGGKPFDNSLPGVIFLHGSGLDHTFWGLHSRFFAFRKYAVLAPDLPAHSHSEGPPLESIEEMFRDVEGTHRRFENGARIGQGALDKEVSSLLDQTDYHGQVFGLFVNENHVGNRIVVAVSTP